MMMLPLQLFDPLFNNYLTVTVKLNKKHVGVANYSENNLCGVLEEFSSSKLVLYHALCFAKFWTVREKLKADSYTTRTGIEFLEKTS